MANPRLNSYFPSADIYSPIETLESNALVFAFHSVKTTAITSTMSNPGGWTNLLDLGGTGSGAVTLSVLYKNQPAIGAVGSAIVSGSSGYWTSIGLYLAKM